MPAQQGFGGSWSRLPHLQPRRIDQRRQDLHAEVLGGAADAEVGVALHQDRHRRRRRYINVLFLIFAPSAVNPTKICRRRRGATKTASTLLAVKPIVHE